MVSNRSCQNLPDKVYWMGEVIGMVDMDMLEAIGQLLAPITDRLDKIDQRTTKIEITLENDIKTRLQLLTEGQQGMNDKFRKLDLVAEDVEEIKHKVTALEAVTKDNTSQIKDIRAVK